MSSKVQTYSNGKSKLIQWSSKPTAQVKPPIRQQTHPFTIIQRIQRNLRSLTAQDVLHLHRTIGNRVIDRLLVKAMQDANPAIPQRQEREEEKPLQEKFDPSETPVQRRGDTGEAENRTGMPRSLKAGLEILSSMDLSGVRVHNNSSQPVQFNALAYTQGQDIYMLHGQEKHLPHEGWHVVQQIQGRVEPTMQKRGVSINNDEKLEHEADVMGTKASQMKRAKPEETGITRRVSSLRSGCSAHVEMIQFFGYKEHELAGRLGSGGKTIVLFAGSSRVKKYELPFGDVVGLAGDYFGSLQEMKKLARSRSGQRKIEYARYRERAIPKEPANLTKTEKKFVDERYFKLNAQNYSHFTQTVTHDNNLNTYLKGHKKAIDAAYAAGQSNRSINEAMLIEAFFDHFLTDAFTAGHITAPRETAELHWGKLYPLFLDNFFHHLAEHMATHINEEAFVAIFASIASIKNTVMAQIRALAPPGIDAYSLGGIITLAIHEFYGKRGLDVFSDVDPQGNIVKGGFKWRAYGEGIKLGSKTAQTQKSMVVAAVAAGLQDITEAYNRGKTNGKIILPPYKVQRYFPKVDPASKRNIDFRWKLNNVDDLVRNRKSPMMRAIEALVGPNGFIGRELRGLARKIKRSHKGTNPRAAYKDWLKQFWRDPGTVIKEVANYDPGGRVYHYSTDIMSRDYVASLKRKGKLTQLTTTQMVGLIKKMLYGGTTDPDEQAIIEVLRAANRKGNIFTVVNQVGGFWRLESDFHGKEWHTLLTVLTAEYFRILSSKSKLEFISWLVKETWREWGEEACIAILNACTRSEFRFIVRSLGKRRLDSFLDGAEQRRFDELLRIHR